MHPTAPVASAWRRPNLQPRTLTIRPQAYHEALQAERQCQTMLDFKAAYAARAGIEGTLS